MAPAKRLLFVVLAVAAAATTARAAPPDRLTTIVDRYEAWRGGAAFRALTSFHESGALEQGGMTGSFDSWASPDHWRDEMHIGGMDMTTVSSKDQSWTTSPSGQPIEAPDAYQSARRLDAIEYGRALLGENGATASLVGEREAGGVTWAVIAVRFGDDDTYQALIDSRTGALGGFTIREHGQVREQRFSDWRMVDGVRMAFRRTERSDGEGTVVSDVRDVAINPRLSSALFAPPAAVRRSNFAAGAVSTGWIPFEFFAGRQIYIPVTVNGHEATALLDSGSNLSIVDSEFAESIGLRAKGAFATPGAGGVGLTGRIPGVTVQVGNLALSELTVGATDMDSLGRAIGRPVPLILGDESFNELVVDIDFANGRLAFIDRDAFTPPRGAAKIALVPAEGARLAPIVVEGGSPALVALDTGDAGTIDLAPSYVQDRALLAGRLSVVTDAVGIGGSYSSIITTLHSVDIAGVRFTEVPAAVPQTWPAATHSDRVQGRLGVGLLKRFHVIIDWSRDALYLAPNPDASAPFTKDRLGISVAPLGRDAPVVVMTVEPHSPAAAAVLKVGDRIETVNGRPATDAMPLGGGNPGERVVLVTRGGSGADVPVTRTVTLADYY